MYTQEREAGKKEEVMVHVRLDSELIKRIDHFAVDEGLYRNQAVEIVLRKGLDVMEKQARLPV